MSRSSTSTAPLFSASTKLGFDSLYEGPALLSKLLELRWVHDDPEQPQTPQANNETIDDTKPPQNKNGGGGDADTAAGKNGAKTSNTVRSQRAAAATATAAMKAKGRVRGAVNGSARKTRTSTRVKQPTQRYQFGNCSDSSSSTESFYSTSDDSAVTVQAVEDDSTHDYVDYDDVQVDVDIVKVIEPGAKPARPRQKSMPFLRRNLSYICEADLIVPTGRPRKQHHRRQNRRRKIRHQLLLQQQESSSSPSKEPPATKQQPPTTQTPRRSARNGRFSGSTPDLKPTQSPGGEDARRGGTRNAFDLVAKLFYKPVANTVKYTASVQSPAAGRAGPKRVNKRKRPDANTARATKTMTLRIDPPKPADFPNHNKPTVLPPTHPWKKTQPPHPLMQTKVFYHYLYRSHDQQATTDYQGIDAQVEERRDRRCPLCFFNAITDTGMLKHLNSTHGEELKFQGGRDEKGDLHIAVRPNPLQRWSSISSRPLNTITMDHLINFCYTSPNYQKQSQKRRRKHSIHNTTPTPIDDIPFIKKPIQQTAFLDPLTRKRKIRFHQAASRDHNDEEGEGDDAGESSASSLEAAVMRRIHSEAISQYVLTGKEPIRQYFHSRTNVPMAEGEWDYDSDDDPIDDAWIHSLSDKLIDEFGDVSPKEKMLMKLWNRFIKSHTIIADNAIPGRCMDFVVQHHGAMITGQLRAQVLAHFMNLWDNRLLSSWHIYRLMKRYDAFVLNH